MRGCAGGGPRLLQRQYAVPFHMALEAGLPVPIHPQDVFCMGETCALWAFGGGGQYPVSRSLAHADSSSSAVYMGHGAHVPVRVAVEQIAGRIVPTGANTRCPLRGPIYGEFSRWLWAPEPNRHLRLPPGLDFAGPPPLRAGGCPVSDTRGGAEASAQTRSHHPLLSPGRPRPSGHGRSDFTTVCERARAGRRRGSAGAQSLCAL